jgi:hypothetical protein
MPHDVADLAVLDAPVVRHAGDTAERVVVVVPLGVNLADDRMLGPRNAGKRAHGCANTVPAAAAAYRFQRARRVWKSQFGCLGE